MWHRRGCGLDKTVEQLPSKGDSSGMKVLDGGGNDGDVVDSDVRHAAVTWQCVECCLDGKVRH